jgi:methyl-accepting chemotaxis protein
VRKLAEESQVAAAEISSLIGEMQSQTRQVVGVVADNAARTEDGVNTVEQTREAFLRIDAAVEGVGFQIAEIATAVEQIASDSARAEGDVGEVAAVAEQSSASAEQVSASTQETSASTQEIAASAQHLAKTAEELNELVSHFKVDVPA